MCVLKLARVCATGVAAFRAARFAKALSAFLSEIQFLAPGVVNFAICHPRWGDQGPEEGFFPLRPRQTVLLAVSLTDAILYHHQLLPSILGSLVLPMLFRSILADNATMHLLNDVTMGLLMRMLVRWSNAWH
jgi:hypothetical protein